MARVCHVTSVHIATDGRIFYHQCRGLSRRHEVSLVCLDDGAERSVDGIRVLPAGKRTGNRLARWRSIRRLISLAEAQRADLYHFHDPELLVAMEGLARRTGVPVIYDAHEHYPDAMRHRAWIPRPLRPMMSALADMTERRLAPRLAAVIVADDALRERFSAFVDRVVAVRNYPPLSTFGAVRPREDGDPTIAYVGSMSAVRGFAETLESFRLVRQQVPTARMLLVGSPTEEVRVRVAELAEPGAEGIELLGPRPYSELPELLAGIDVGLALLKDDPKFHKNVATKVFDYMAAGRPFVASDFPPLRALVGEGCGLLVPPGDPRAAADAIVRLLQDRPLGMRMGESGRALVEERLNWEREEQALLGLYDELLGTRA